MTLAEIMPAFVQSYVICNNAEKLWFLSTFDSTAVHVKREQAEAKIRVKPNIKAKCLRSHLWILLETLKLRLK